MTMWQRVGAWDQGSSFLQNSGTYSGGFVVRLTSHQCPDRVRLEIQRKELSDAKPIRDSWPFPHSPDRGL